MAKVMVTIHGGARPPTMEDVRRRFDLADHDIDTAFGVVEVDPRDHVYTVLVEESAAARMHPDEEWHVEGPYSNPRIEPFGPPASSPQSDESARQERG